MIICGINNFRRIFYVKFTSTIFDKTKSYIIQESKICERAVVTISVNRFSFEMTDEYFIAREAYYFRRKKIKVASYIKLIS